MKIGTSDAVIGFPRESTPGDRRTLLTPTVARALADAGFTVIAEQAIAAGIGCPDAVLQEQGVRFVDASGVWSAPLLLRYKCTDPDDLALLTSHQSIGALFHAEGDPRLLTALTAAGVTAYSYEFLAEDGRFPLGTPGGQIAGVQSVLLGTLALQSSAGRGVLLGGVLGAEPARVVVIGSGNVGAAAARAAAALGARVTVLVRSETSAESYASCAPRVICPLLVTCRRPVTCPASWAACCTSSSIPCPRWCRGPRARRTRRTLRRTWCGWLTSFFAALMTR